MKFNRGEFKYEIFKCHTFIGSYYWTTEGHDRSVTATKLMERDESDRVREKCTQLIGLNKHTLLCIIDRCRDVAPNVRRTAYKRISQKVYNLLNNIMTGHL